MKRVLPRLAAALLAMGACLFSPQMRAATTEEQVAELVKNYTGSLVFVEDKGGAGSARCVDFVGHFGSVSAVASPGGGTPAGGPPAPGVGHLLVSAGYDTSVKVWDAAKGGGGGGPRADRRARQRKCCPGGAGLGPQQQQRCAREAQSTQ